MAAFEDARGRMWFRTEGNVYNYASIRGLLVYDGGTFDFHDLGVPDTASQPRVGALAQRDPDHLWVTTTEQGLCSLDAATAALERVPEQPPEARWTQAIFPRGGDWLFSAARPATAAPTRSGGCAPPLGKARRRRGRQFLHRLPPRRTAAGARRRWRFPRRQRQRAVVLADEGAPVRLDWRRASRSPPRADSSPCRMAAVGWAWTPTAGAGPGASMPCWPRPPRRTIRACVLESSRETLVADRRRHLWGGFQENPRTLREWDGEKWIAHDLPPETVPPEGYRTLMGVEARQRVWMRAEWGSNRRMFIYDPAGDGWQSCDEFEQALEAQAPLGREAEPPFQENTYDLARYRPGGQICYYSRQSKIAWFDGRQWHR